VRGGVRLPFPPTPAKMEPHRSIGEEGRRDERKLASLVDQRSRAVGVNRVSWRLAMNYMSYLYAFDNCRHDLDVVNATRVVGISGSWRSKPIRASQTTYIRRDQRAPRDINR
jgi:hypothetical protein